MKNMSKVFGFIACVAVMGFMMSCGDGGGGDSGPDYKAIAQNQISFVSGSYELIIMKTSENRAAGAAESFSPVNGDDYNLLKNGSVVSSGTVTISSDTYTFTPDEASGGSANKFSAIYSSTGDDKGSLKINGTVKDKNGNALADLGNMTTMSWGPSGKWKGTGNHNEPGYGVFPWEATITVKGSFDGGTWNWALTIYNPGKAGVYGTDASTGNYTAVGNTFVATTSTYTAATAYMIDANTMSVTVPDYFGTTTTATFTRQP